MSCHTEHRLTISERRVYLGSELARFTSRCSSIILIIRRNWVEDRFQVFIAKIKRSSDTWSWFSCSFSFQQDRVFKKKLVSHFITKINVSFSGQRTNCTSGWWPSHVFIIWILVFLLNGTSSVLFSNIQSISLVFVFLTLCHITFSFLVCTMSFFRYGHLNTHLNCED